MASPDRALRGNGVARQVTYVSVIVIVATAMLLLMARHVRSTVAVDLVLVLALDVSESVNNREFELQKIGLARAFRHAAVVDAIQRGPSKRIAVAAVQWSGYQDQYVSLAWQTVSDAASAAAFAKRLADMPRRYPNDFTHIAGAIEFSSRLIAAAPYLAPRRVIDVSGDGENNVHAPPGGARDAAVRAGVTINGLAILNEFDRLDDYYRRNVIGGPGAFVEVARDYDDFAAAMLRKLLREISNFVS